jgi:hypothetical protein
MGQFKDLISLDSKEIMPEIYLFDLAEYDSQGQILVTVYSDKVTIAHRSRISERWSYPTSANRVV